MRLNSRQKSFILDVLVIGGGIAFMLAFLVFLSGCDKPLRFAPTESQKQLALRTHLNAKKIDAVGSDPCSPVSSQVKEGTRVSLDYIGLPADPDIADYPATLTQAGTDATKRPTSKEVFNAVNKSLNLVELILMIIGGTTGLGAVAFGARKGVKYVSSLKSTASEFEQDFIAIEKAFIEVIGAEQEFKRTLRSKGKQTIQIEEALGTLKEVNHAKQSKETTQMVTELKS